MKRELLSIIIICIILSGCSVQKHKSTRIYGKGYDYKATSEVILGSIIKKDIIPPSNLGFIDE